MNFQTKLQQFEGPLDLLLRLIEKEELDISEIALAHVADQFLLFIEKQNVDPKAITEFLLVASQLIVIKSRILIPSLEIEKEEEEDIEELQRRLKEYQRFKKIASILRQKGEKRQYLYTREALANTKQRFLPPPELTVSMLQKLFANIIEEIPEPEVLPKKNMKDIISIEERIKELHTHFQKNAQEKFSNIIKRSKNKNDVIISFLAILELFKKQMIIIEQQQHCGEMIVTSRP